MNLSSLNLQGAADAGVEIQLRHPVSGVPLDAFVTIRGRDSAVCQAKIAELARRRLEQQAQGVPIDQVTRAQSEVIETLAALTVGWRGLEVGTDPLTFSEAAAAKLYADRGLSWIREQIEAAIDRRALFLPGGAAS